MKMHNLDGKSILAITMHSQQGIINVLKKVSPRSNILNKKNILLR